MNEIETSILVEWDNDKDKINIQKHGIGFDTASLIFADPNRLEFFDEWHSCDEDRFITIGEVNKILVVVYTNRGETIRLISARVANAKERSIYYGND